jgi:hypothetical protein
MRLHHLLALWLGVALWAGLARAQAPVAQPPLTGVTFENFVSLDYTVKSSLGKPGARVIIADDGTLSKTTTGPLNSRVEVQHLRLRDYAALFNTLNNAKFLTLAGDYRQRGLLDGRQEDVTLQVTDAAGQEHSFTVRNYGNTAPAPVTAVLAYLNTLAQEVNGDAAAATVTRGNFRWLRVEENAGAAEGEAATILLYDGGGVETTGKAADRRQEVTTFSTSDEALDEVLALLDGAVKGGQFRAVEAPGNAPAGLRLVLALRHAQAPEQVFVLDGEQGRAITDAVKALVHRVGGG